MLFYTVPSTSHHFPNNKYQIPTFYLRVRVQSSGTGVTVDVVSVDSEACDLENLGAMADMSGGTVTKVKASELTSNFAGILANPILASQVIVYPKADFARATYRHTGKGRGEKTGGERGKVCVHSFEKKNMPYDGNTYNVHFFDRRGFCVTCSPRGFDSSWMVHFDSPFWRMVCPILKCLFFSPCSRAFRDQACHGLGLLVVSTYGVSHRVRCVSPLPFITPCPMFVCSKSDDHDGHFDYNGKQIIGKGLRARDPAQGAYVPQRKRRLKRQHAGQERR